MLIVGVLHNQNFYLHHYLCPNHGLLHYFFIFVLCHLLQDLIVEQRAKMPTCNLAEIMHNKCL